MRAAMLENSGEPTVHVFFLRHPVHEVERCKGGRILWWAFESDRLPSKWLEEIQIYDEIWVPSEWARSVLALHGVASERIRIVELGVDATIYKPAPVTHENFIFLSVGKYEKRKSIDEIVEAFVCEFPAKAYPQVRLWLKADYPAFPHRVQQLTEKLSFDNRILVIAGEAPDETMARLYNMADAFLFPSKAEGFGLPCIEALACAIPVLATDVSGQSTYLSRIPGLFAPVAFKRVPIFDDDYRHFYHADYGDSNFGNWAAPPVSSIRLGMRSLFESPDIWRDKALQASALIRREFSWEAIAHKTVAAIQEVDQRARIARPTSSTVD